jgi:hypothetical protein
MTGAPTTIRLPWPKPPLTGNRTRGNPYARAVEVKATVEGAQYAIRAAKPKPMVGANVTLHFRPKDRRRRDADAHVPDAEGHPGRAGARGCAAGRLMGLRALRYLPHPRTQRRGACDVGRAGRPGRGCRMSPDRPFRHLCPEADLRDAMTDGEFWEHVAAHLGHNTEHIDYDGPDIDVAVSADPCLECGEVGACAYDAEGRALIHAARDEDA